MPIQVKSPHPRSRLLLVALPYALLLSLLLLLPAPSLATTGVTRPTVVQTRGADPNSLTSDLDATEFGDNANATCNYDGGTISLSHPMSLKPSDKFYSTGQLQLSAIEMMVDAINTSPRCGVGVGGKRYGLTLTTYGDDSSKAKVGSIVRNGMLPTPPEPSFWLGPYSSGLTGIMSPFANDTQSVLVAGGAASTSVFQGSPTVFGTFPPTRNYLAQAVKALAEAGAKTAASVWEDAAFTRGVCAALPDLAESHGMVLQSQTEVESDPTSAHLDPVAALLSNSTNDPDVVVTCVYAAGCAEWIASLRRSGWSPRAQVFTVCVGMDSFSEAVGTDAEYMMGISPWDSSLPGQDELVGWSAAEFAEKFERTTFRTPTYHAASAAASVGVLVQALERADSLDSGTVAEVLATGEFATLYGKIGFNDDGQSKAPALVLQYDSDMTVQTVYPLEQLSGDMVFPMPTWDHRDCMTVSSCEAGSGYALPGTCRNDGSCDCTDDERAVSVGVGRNASCVLIPEEDMTFVSSAMTAVGIALFVIQCLLSLLAAVWTYYFRKRSVVKASQPEFLLLICLGTLLIAAGIIPSGIQGRYRYVLDPLTREQTDVQNPDIRRADAACMALPWLFCIGFVTVFSALFAKIWRIKKIVEGSQRFIRRRVAKKDVSSIMVGLLAVTVTILLTWQLVDPLRWERAVITTDAGGYPTKSVGTCQSDNVNHFLIPLLIVDGGCLIYALYLCYITRKVPSHFSEGKWITASVISIFQILVLSIPIMVIVENDNNAFYFVRTLIMFLMSTTVTLFIFLPKAYKVHFKEDSSPSGSRMINRFNMNADTSGGDRLSVISAISRVSGGGKSQGSDIAEMRRRAAKPMRNIKREHSSVGNNVSEDERHSSRAEPERHSGAELERHSSSECFTLPRRRSTMTSMGSVDDHRSSGGSDMLPRRPSMVTFATDLENQEEGKNGLRSDGDRIEQSPEKDKGKKDEEGIIEAKEEMKRDDLGLVL